ncbi:MAG: YggU family protein [Nitrospirae bacterium]|nr:YggU family protein [Nitrospirota bacterium]
MNVLIVQDTTAGVVLSVHIQPNTSTTECVGIHGDAVKIRVAAPPVDGAANDELIRFLARRLSIPVSSVQIKSGAGGRRKRVVIKGASAEFVLACLNVGDKSGSVKL